MRRAWRLPTAVLALSLLIWGTTMAQDDKAQDNKGEDAAWAAFEIDDLKKRREDVGLRYLPFIDEASMSVGLYELPAGAEDPQSPHDRDEIYHVVAGKARLSVADEDVAVGPGSTVWVKKGVEHRFHSIEEDLSVLVVFAPGRE